MGGAGPIEKAVARQVGTLAAKSTFFFVCGGGQRAPPPPPFLPPLKAPPAELQHVGSNIGSSLGRAARPPPSQSCPHGLWRLASPLCKVGHWQLGWQKGRWGALYPCEKGPLALAQLASPTAGCRALALGVWPHIWWPIAKQNKKMGCAWLCSCPKAVSPWVGVPQQLLVYVDAC